MGDFFAHSTGDRSRRNWHRLSDHLKATGKLAALFANAFGADRAAELAGLLHDLGKYTPAFQARLHGAREKVDHATAGAQEVTSLVDDPKDRVMAELIAFAIAGHHAGLADRTGGAGSLAARLDKKPAPLDPVWRDEITPDAKALLPPFRWSERTLAFQLAFLGRMIFSCLVDADFRDTESFYCRVEGRRPERDWRPLAEVIDEMIAAFDTHMAAKQAKARTSDVNRLRTEILAEVRKRAGDTPGFFSLTVPTGGGKTLTSLGFALDHARSHGLERIIYAIPFTSIIDQTADEFRKVLGAQHVLEHHAAIEEEKLRCLEQRDKLRLAMEDWAAPLIVTTNVQFFESLFADRPARCRKLHNIARSVIVLDEAQTIPLALLRPCMEALRELAANYACSIILCTATPPALAAPDFPDGLPLEGRELAPDPSALARRLRRVKIRFRDALTDHELVAALAETPQGLVIVNSRKHALTLYRSAKEAGLDGMIHLSTRQYAAHRRTILDDVRRRLAEGHPCRLIATSLVEAGVDLDFPRVWRAEAGLEQVAQAAGRCNREGRRAVEGSIVTVFRAADDPPPFEIRQLAEDFMRIAHKHEDPLLPEAIRDYFREVYWRKGTRGLDGEDILGEFRLNGWEADFPYRTVARKFRMIRSGMVPVIIARDRRVRKVLDRLGIDGVRAGRVARDLQTFTVQVPPGARTTLLAAGHAAFECEDRFGDQFCVLRTESFYREDVGLLWEDAEYLGLENSII